MVKYVLILMSFLFASINGLCQEEKEGFVVPHTSKEIKKLISEARSAYGKNAHEGIAQMKNVIAICHKEEKSSIDFFNSTFELGILYYQSSYMDSALYTFRNCLTIADQQKNHYLHYKSYLGFARVHYYNGAYDSTEIYASKGLKHSQTINYQRGIANLYNMLGVVAGHNGDFDQSTFYKEKSLQMAKDQQDTLGIFLAAYNLAVHLQGGKEYRKCLEYSIYAQKIAKASKSNYQYGSACTALSVVYSNLGDYKKSLNYIKLAADAHKKAVEIGEDESHTQWLMFAYLRRGIIYTKIDSSSLARHFIKKAILYFDSTKKLESRVSAYSQYAKSFLKDNMLDSALHYALIANELGGNTNYVIEKMGSSMTLASVYHSLKKSDQAINYANIGLKLAEENNYYDNVNDAASILYEIYDARGKAEKALYFLKKLNAARDTLENEERVKAVTRLSMQFEFDNEKQALEFAKKQETLLLNQQIQREKAIQYGAFAGVALLFLALFIFYRFYINKKRDHFKITAQAKELKEKNEQLLDLSRYKEGLSNMIVHDMKNPLNAIIGLTEEEVFKKDNQHIINRSGKMILQLVNNIMDIQKFEEAKMQLDENVYYLHEIVDYAQQQVMLLMNENSMTFENDLGDRLLVSVDAEVVSRVIVNLLTNAIKYSSRGSKISVVAKDNGTGYHELSITDYGQGIKATQLPYIFDKFWQVNAKKSGKTYSTGLGLTFCKLAIEAHEGTISVTSKIGEGTSFMLSIPVSAQQTSPMSLEINKAKELTMDFSSYTKEDLIILEAITKKIKDIPLYKAGEIEKSLNQVNYESLKINEWIQTVKEAVLNWDQQRYDQLVQFGDANPPL